MKDFKHSIIILFLLLGIKGFSTMVFPKKYDTFLKYDCDACGCSNNGGSLGMGGVLENNFVGLRYLNQQYESKSGTLKNAPKIDEYFNTLQFWSRIPIVKGLEVQTFVPYHFHHRKYLNKTTEIKGLGDITLISNYILLDKKGGSISLEDKKMSMTNHLLKIGLGIKLPTGKYSQKINNSTNPSFQLGTGSIDYISNLQYVFKYNDFGVSNMLNYYYKNSNKKEYHFGNQFNFNSTFFYVLKNNRNAFVPSLGISGEFYNKNKQFGYEIKDTNGYVINSSIGMEYNTKKITFGASGIYPINQNLAQGEVEARYRTSVYLNYNF